MKWLAWVVLLVSLVLAPPASAQFYKYWDKQGNIRFTDDINQVPENQRTKVRSYAEVQSPAPSAESPDEGAKKMVEAGGAALDFPAPSTLSAASDGQPLDAARARVEELKKQVAADYQTLVKEKDALDKEKDAKKTHDQVVDYNKRVEAFNQRAGHYETRSAELRKQVEDYNARVMEENAKAASSAFK
jgi:hypothetical protein